MIKTYIVEIADIMPTINALIDCGYTISGQLDFKAYRKEYLNTLNLSDFAIIRQAKYNNILAYAHK